MFYKYYLHVFSCAYRQSCESQKLQFSTMKHTLSLSLYITLFFTYHLSPSRPQRRSHSPLHRPLWRRRRMASLRAFHFSFTILKIFSVLFAFFSFQNHLIGISNLIWGFIEFQMRGFGWGFDEVSCCKFYQDWSCFLKLWYHFDRWFCFDLESGFEWCSFIHWT